MKKRIWAMFVVCTCVMLLAVGCGKSKQTETDDGQVTEEEAKDTKETATDEAAVGDGQKAAQEGKEDEQEEKAEESVDMNLVLDMKSSDNKYQVKVPADWKADSELANDATQLSLSNDTDTACIVGIEEAKADLTVDLSGYTDLVAKQMEATLTDAKTQEKELFVMPNGLSAYRMELSGSIDEVNVAYFVYTVEGIDSYYQVVTWTVPSLAENMSKLFDEVAKTFTEL